MGVPGTDLQGWKWVRGRARRREYCLWVIVALAWVGILGPAGSPFTQVVLSYAVAFQIFRRLHDIGLSGWWYPGFVLLEIALIGGLSVELSPEWATLIAAVLAALGALVLGLVPGNRQTNRFGAPPGATGRTWSTIRSN